MKSRIDRVRIPGPAMIGGFGDPVPPEVGIGLGEGLIWYGLVKLTVNQTHGVLPHLRLIRYAEWANLVANVDSELGITIDHL